MFLINLVIHYRLKERTDLETVSFPYLIRCIKTAGELSNVTDGEIKPYTKKLEDSYINESGIIKNTRFLFPTSASFPDSGILLYLTEYPDRKVEG